MAFEIPSIDKRTLILLAKILLLTNTSAFTPLSTRRDFARTLTPETLSPKINGAPLFVASSIETENEVKALPSKSSIKSIADQIAEVEAAAEPASVAFMVTNEMKRTLIEELGFRRQEAYQIRAEIASVVIDKRLLCPTGGMPANWYRQEEEQNQMLEKLKNESKYPLKFPLLAVSLILSGKGISDAFITVVKVNMGFKGASMTENFMGIPVLGIDFVCAVAGFGLGAWTFMNMKD